ncbi:MAG: transglutaminase domain-containing protein [Ghiorsea sp.]
MDTIKPNLMMGLTFVVLIFWGWQTDMLWLGMLLGLVYLSVWFIKGKYTFETSSFFQIADLCALIAGATFAFIWIDDRASQAVYPTLRLLPVALLPLLLIQLLDKRHSIPVNTFLFLKRKENTTWFDMSALYIVVCLFAAGASETKQLTYFVGVVSLLFVLLWFFQSQKGLKLKLGMSVLFSMAVGLALLMQWGLIETQKRIEASINQWLMQQHQNIQTSTAIGSVGRLKLSDEILFRVMPLDEKNMPMLLRSGSYQRYHLGTWFGGSWTDIKVPQQDTKWILQPQSSGNISKLRFFQSFEKKKATLPLPTYPNHINKLAADSLLIQQGGSVLAAGLPAFATFDVGFQRSVTTTLVDDVGRSDTRVNKDVAQVIANIAKSIGLYPLRKNEGDKAVVRKLHAYFLNQFTYATYQTEDKEKRNPLVRFLTQTQQGHCEYFATATVMILREVGIPARYATGYSMHEWDKENGLFNVRARDAHAWVLAFINGAWVDVDNTPPNWLEVENSDVSSLQDLKDWFSELSFLFKKWRYSESEDYTPLWLGLVLFLFSILAWRVLRRVKVEEQVVTDSPHESAFISSWQQLEDDLVKQGFTRFTGESLTTWLTRIKKTELIIIVELYYQQRFGGYSFSAKQLEEFDSLVEEQRKLLSQQDTNQ